MTPGGRMAGDRPKLRVIEGGDPVARVPVGVYIVGAMVGAWVVALALGFAAYAAWRAVTAP